MDELRLLNPSSNTVPYFLKLAESLGHTIENEEFWPSVSGALQAGQPLIAEGEQFTWRIKLELISEWIFRTGVNQAREMLGGIEISDIECELPRQKTPRP
ncbi:hypothetical protein G3A39_43850 [Paraburkholderia aspalathi]|nr:hypothetical protein [Paraburkholderia aspalathi]